MSASFQITEPRNALRDKLGSKAPTLDAAAVARAEAALKSLSGKFQEWMEDEVEKLDTCRRQFETDPCPQDPANDIYRAAHDVKGMGATYEYPLITRIAASLCTMLETPEARQIAMRDVPLIIAHIDAIKAAVRGQIKTVEHPIGGALCQALEERVRTLYAGFTGG